MALNADTLVDQILTDLETPEAGKVVAKPNLVKFFNVIFDQMKMASVIYPSFMAMTTTTAGPAYGVALPPITIPVGGVEQPILFAALFATFSSVASLPTGLESATKAYNAIATGVSESLLTGIYLCPFHSITPSVATGVVSAYTGNNLSEITIMKLPGTGPTIESTVAGTVESLEFNSGDTVAINDVILTLDSGTVVSLYEGIIIYEDDIEVGATVSRNQTVATIAPDAGLIDGNTLSARIIELIAEGDETTETAITPQYQIIWSDFADHVNENWEIKISANMITYTGTINPAGGITTAVAPSVTCDINQ